MYEDIKNYFKENKVPDFRFKQFETAVFKQFINSFDEITVFPKTLREQLSKEFKVFSLSLVSTHKSSDTVKFVLKTFDNHFIESVLMLHNIRRTVCVSSQIFCTLGCKFCATGANKFRRNLTTQEIVEQVLIVNQYLKSQNLESVSNVVFMGMGEPFLNYTNVVNSLKILNDENYLEIGARHITISTAGIVPKIYEFIKLGIQVRLAISLHAPNDKLRSELMPINDKYNLFEVLKATDEFSKVTNKRVSFEYVLIKDVNDSKDCALELASILSNRLAYVNLLVFNPQEFSDFKKPDMKTVLEFKKVLDEKGIECSVRKSMGDDISGACGQLSGKREKRMGSRDQR